MAIVIAIVAALVVVACVLGVIIAFDYALRWLCRNDDDALGEPA